MILFTNAIMNRPLYPSVNIGQTAKLIWGQTSIYCCNNDTVGVELLIGVLMGIFQQLYLNFDLLIESILSIIFYTLWAQTSFF